MCVAEGRNNQDEVEEKTAAVLHKTYEVFSIPIEVMICDIVDIETDYMIFPSQVSLAKGALTIA